MRLDNIEFEQEEETPKRFNIKLDKEKLFIIEAAVGIVVLIVLIIIAGTLLFGKKSDNETPEDIQIEEELQSPNEEAIEAITDETEPSANTSADTDATAVNSEDQVKNDVTEITKTTPVKGELAQTYTAGNMLTYTKDSYQLPEIYSYWDNYQLEAVGDLIRLDRVRTITNSLGKSNDFYYYGSTNSNGQPDGRGLAVYAYNTYYFGDWSNGKREGNGMWIRLFIDDTGIVNGVKGVKEHQYNGSWSDDLPCGSGQEHIEYDTSKIDKEFVISNAIGEFKDGYYQGSMYIMTIDQSGRTIDWYGTCEKGSFVFLSDKKTNLGKRSVWKAGDGYDTGEEDNCRWMMPKDNVNFGIAGLKK